MHFFKVNEDKIRRKGMVIYKQSFCLSLFFLCLFILGAFWKFPHSTDPPHEIRVGVIDGVSTDPFNLVIKRRTYTQSAPEFTTHANLIWSLVSQGISPSKIRGFEYSVINQKGEVHPQLFLKALEKAEQDQVEIINFSGGFYLENEKIQKKIEEMTRHHIIFVAAGGNHPQGVADFPARMPQVIAVGSKNETGPSPFSSTKKINLYAKGEKIRYKNKFYEGTSFATPKVTNQIIAYSLEHHVSLIKAKTQILKDEN